MTDLHQTLPTEQAVRQWLNLPLSTEELLVIAYRAGSDMELEACKQVILDQEWFGWPEPRLAQLHNARRPKPLSETDQALTDLEQLLDVAKSSGVFNPPNTIRRALERLKKLEEAAND